MEYISSHNHDLCFFLIFLSSPEDMVFDFRERGSKKEGERERQREREGRKRETDRQTLK